VKRRVLKVCTVCVVCALLAIPCCADNDSDFQAVVRAIEAQYGVHHMRIPMLGFATLCLRVAGTPGAAGLKLAVFENVRSKEISSASLEQAIQTAVGDRWKPLVRVRSRDEGELTMVYTNPADKEVRVLIVAVDGNNATVVQTKVKASQIEKWIHDPEDATHIHDGDSDREAD
jgi:hypothetical protein